MSEIVKLKQKRDKIKVRITEIKIEWDAIIRDLKYKLDPFEKIEDVEVDECSVLIKKLKELQKEYKEKQRELKKIQEELGE